MVINTTNELLANINTLLEEINRTSTDTKQTEMELKRILKEMDELVRDENYYLERIDIIHGTGENIMNSSNIEIICADKSNKKIALGAQNILKPIISSKEINKEYRCDRKIEKTIPEYLKYSKKEIRIESQDDLDSFIEKIEKQCLLFHAYTHSYHTYLPYTCFLLVRTETNDFIFDLLKYPDLFPETIFSCDFDKFMSYETLLIISKEFCLKMCCFKLVKVQELFLVDWRIKVDSSWFQIRVDDLLDTSDYLKKYVGLNVTSHYDATENIEAAFNRISQKISTENESPDKLMKILKLRDFIAKTNNESPNYVMTERQIFQIFEKEEIKRASPLMRAHTADIMFIIENKSKLA